MWGTVSAPRGDEGGVVAILLVDRDAVPGILFMLGGTDLAWWKGDCV